MFYLYLNVNKPSGSSCCGFMLFFNMMMEDKILQQISRKESTETISNELISEEQMPSLCCISLTESMCSDDTIDLEDSKLSEHFSLTNEIHPKVTLTPLENNFMVDKNEDFQCDKLNTEVSCTMNSTTDTTNALNNSSRISLSLHDVSNLIPLQLTEKSTNTVSCETLHSQSLSSTTKSKDSGFQRSYSCLSLNSSRRNYDHVESKVKAYIKNIKDSEALRKKNKLLQSQQQSQEFKDIVCEDEIDFDKNDLILQIQELKHELEEKAIFIDTQQRNYNNLLLKFAEAKITIDSLRLQKDSLNYSTDFHEMTGGSKPLNNINTHPFKTTSRNLKNENSIYYSENELNKTGKNSSFELISNSSPAVSFKPKHNSTPCKKEENFSKCLSPVSKMFSSSSRLDANRKPLSNVQKLQIVHKSTFQSEENIDCQHCVNGIPTNHSAERIKPVSHIDNKKQMYPRECRSVGQIDLPNDDPFDKVKKWQASLPSINLLGTSSSSEIEDFGVEMDHDHKPVTHKAQEINLTLSKELHVKCKISDILNSIPTNEDSTENTCKEINGEASITKENTFNVEHTLNSSKDCNTVRSNKPVRIVSKHVFPNPVETQLLSSTSEKDTQSLLPNSSKASSFENQRETSTKSDDDSSSVSSSVLGSKAACAPAKGSKRRSTCVGSANPSKAPKFVLRKPMLNFEQNQLVVVDSNKVTSPKRSTVPKNSNLSSSLMLKTESSQRRAWNARNSTSFNVCKEFYFKKSSSLQESFDIMQEMINEGSSIIKNTLNRSHCH